MEMEKKRARAELQLLLKADSTAHRVLTSSGEAHLVRLVHFAPARNFQAERDGEELRPITVKVLKQLVSCLLRCSGG